ncbi:MAG: exodeoxyribonuclease VII large subunit [Pseudomonadota bacterium]
MSEQNTYSDTGNAKSNLIEYSVTEISASLKKTVEERFGNVRVRGEITGYRGPHSSGHCYFALKDDRARIEAVIWRGSFNRLKHKPEEGLEVIASGKLTTYPGSSKYQIVIDNLEPAGAGALMALLEERKKKLEAEGLFAPERKQLLPFMPKKIGVVTSPTGSVIRDILHRISDRYPLHISVWPVRVQGETTGAEVSNAIDGFNAMPETERPELIIVARGGGSIEDLWGFNDEAVVRAAANSDIPLISAVGHETDWTLIDYAADIRAPTPTGAAELAVPVKADLDATVASFKARLKSALSRQLDQARSSLLAATRGLATPDNLLALPRRRLDEASNRLGVGLDLSTRAKRNAYDRIASRLSHRGLENTIARNTDRLSLLSQRGASAFSNRLERTKTRVEQASRMLDSLSYKGVLARGYAVVRNEKGKPVNSAAAIKAGAAFDVEFKDGNMAAIAAGDRAAKPKAKKSASPKKHDPKDQGSLF